MGKTPERAILLIEDNADVVRFLLRLLEPLGAEVVAVADGEAARRASKKAPPDLMLVDLVLPGMSGLDAVRAIKKDDPRLAATPVVVLTAHPSPDNIREAVDLGVVDYLVKPTFLSEAGLDRIRRALEAAPKAPAPRLKG
ncbi:MAG TPA: response regulator [Planctomycetota bacterium]